VDGCSSEQACAGWNLPRAVAGPMDLSVGTYNPMSLVATGRANDISLQAQSVDVLVLPGTRYRARNKDVTTEKLSAHQAFHWGYGAGPFTNRSAGLSILLGGKVRHKRVVEVKSPPGSLQGRAGAVRVKQGPLDIMIIGMYFPPAAAGHQKQLARVKAVKALIMWVQEIIHQCPARCVPLLFMDANTPLGVREGVAIDDEHVGMHGIAEHTRVSDLLYEFMIEEGLAALNTFWEVGPTFYGPRGGHSVIDYVMVPVEFMARVSKCCASIRLAKRLQLISCHSLRDHIPVLARCRFEPFNVQSKEATAVTKAWDMDAVSACLQTGKDRQKFLREVEQSLLPVEAELTDLLQHNIHCFWERWVDIVKEVGGRHETLREGATGGRVAAGQETAER